jgi:hypothetical protein
VTKPGPCPAFCSCEETWLSFWIRSSTVLAIPDKLLEALVPKLVKDDWTLVSASAIAPTSVANFLGPLESNSPAPYPPSGIVQHYVDPVATFIEGHGFDLGQVPAGEPFGNALILKVEKVEGGKAATEISRPS